MKTLDSLRRACVAAVLASLALLTADDAARGGNVFPVVQDGGRSWDRTVTLPEFPPESRLLAHLRVINRGDPWDRHGRVRIQTPGGQVDVVKFITGFGGTYWNDPVDITALRPLLKGRVRFRAQIDQNSGWSMDFHIEEIPGGNPGAPSAWVAPIVKSGTTWAAWIDGGFSAGRKAFTVRVPDPETRPLDRVYLTYYVSGHGGSDGVGCCEFHSLRHRIWVDGTRVLAVIPWREASTEFRNRNPTSGRFPNGWSSDFARSNWLPGDTVRPFVVDVTGALAPSIGGEHTVEFLVDGNMGGGMWPVSSFMSATAPTEPPFRISTAFGNGADAGVSENDDGDRGNGRGPATSARFNGTNRNEVAFLRFDLSRIAPGSVTAASLSLIPWRDATSSSRFRVLGLRDGRPGQNWDERAIRASNAPGFTYDGRASTSGIDLASNFDVGVWKIGSQTRGVAKTFTSPRLLTFLNADTDGLVTFVIHNLTGNYYPFATREATALDGGSPTGNTGDFAAFLTLRTGALLNPVRFVPAGAPVRLLVPARAGDAPNWMARDFDDARWRPGLTGIGYDRDDADDAYEQLIATDVAREMYRINGSVYIRASFWLGKRIHDLTRMTLRMKYDDGFVAYLNGARLASANSPDPLTWNSLATANHNDAAAVEFEAFDVTRFKNALVAGNNVLAVQGLNGALDSSDMLIVPELVAIGTGEPCDARCLGLDLSLVDGSIRATARAKDDSRDPIRYTFRIQDRMGNTTTLDPQAGNVALFDVPPGSYTVSVSLSDGTVACTSSEDAVCGGRITVPEGGLQVPGDCTQDGSLDISDPVCLLGFLFVGSTSRLPCGNGSREDGANITLLDSNGDGEVDLSDAISALTYLFAGGPAHVSGVGCRRVSGCSNVCRP